MTDLVYYEMVSIIIGELKLLQKNIYYNRINICKYVLYNINQRKNYINKNFDKNLLNIFNNKILILFLAYKNK